MFSRYLQFINGIIDTLKSGKGELTFFDYLSVLGQTFLLIGVLAIIVAIIFASIGAPKFVWTKTVGKINVKLNELLKSLNGTSEDISAYEDMDTLEKKLKKSKIVYFILLFAVYIPFIVPTILYVLYLIFHI